MPLEATDARRDAPVPVRKINGITRPEQRVAVSIAT